MKCNDCGQPFKTERYKGRTDVCDPCLVQRDRLVAAMGAGQIAPPVFTAIQRAMANGRGTAAKKIRKALAGIVAVAAGTVGGMM